MFFLFNFDSFQPYTKSQSMRKKLIKQLSYKKISANVKIYNSKKKIQLLICLLFFFLFVKKFFKQNNKNSFIKLIC